jgi:hypothetical protein
MRKLLMTASAFCLLTLSCEVGGNFPIPDLDPNSSEGGEMLIFDIGELISYNSQTTAAMHLPSDYDVTYDVGNAGIDFRFRENGFPGPTNPNFLTSQFRASYEMGQMLTEKHGSSLTPGEESINVTGMPIYLPADALLGSTVEGTWTVPGTGNYIWQESGTSSGPWQFNYRSFPPGISYIPTRTDLGGQWFYGWIEVIASDYTDGDPNDFILFSRFGISTTAGVRVRMGKG